VADEQGPENFPTSGGSQKKTLADLKGIDFDYGFYCSIAFKAAVELRTALKIDEVTFRKIDLSAWPDPRPAFIYRVLDEIQKAGLCINEWFDKLKDDSTPDASDHEIRLNHQWLLDEQNFRARKLTEVLVDLICFSDTNEPEYYRDYLRFHELNATVNVLKDQDKFYGFRRQNYEYGVDLKAGSIVAGEAKLDVRKRWFLKEPGSFQDRWKTHGVEFRSFRQKYIHSLGLALPSEVAMLGKSYMLTYGRMSSDIHFTPQEIWKFNPNAVEVGFINVGMLCFEILIRCQRLLGIVPEGLNTDLRKIHDEATPSEIVADLKEEKAKVGDFVRTKGYICEVMKIGRSELGYVSYLLRYLERPPIPEIKEDWFAGFEIRLVAEKSFADETLVTMQADPVFGDMSDEERKERFDEAIVRLFRALHAAKPSDAGKP
jgi:hypothetical protein